MGLLGKATKAIIFFTGFYYGNLEVCDHGVYGFPHRHGVEYRHTHILQHLLLHITLLLLSPSHLGGFLLTLPTLHRSLFMRLKYYQTLCRLHTLQPQLPCMP